LRWYSEYCGFWGVVGVRKEAFEQLKRRRQEKKNNIGRKKERGEMSGKEADTNYGLKGRVGVSMWQGLRKMSEVRAREPQIGKKKKA